MDVISKQYLAVLMPVATQSSTRTAEDLKAVAAELDSRVSQFKF